VPSAVSSQIGELSLLVNGERLEIPAPCSVEGLLQQLTLERRRVAVAVNRNVVPRSAFGTHQLVSEDRVEILEAVGGG
jgi:sulfur carrier protein